MVLRALRIKKLSGDLCAMIGGRHTHPCALTVGGFTHLPTEAELRDDARPASSRRVPIWMPPSTSSRRCPGPQFERETEYVCLQKEDEYAFIDGTVVTSDGFSYPIEDYRKVTNESCVPFSTAKWTHHNRDAYMVGALARFNNNYDQLHPTRQGGRGQAGTEAGRDQPVPEHGRPGGGDRALP